MHVSSRGEILNGDVNPRESIHRHFSSLGYFRKSCAPGRVLIYMTYVKSLMKKLSVWGRDPTHVLKRRNAGRADESLIRCSRTALTDAESSITKVCVVSM